MRKFLLVLYLAAGPLLAACSSTIPHTVPDVSPSYRANDLGRAGGGRDTYVVLRGNPFAMDPARFEQLVLSNMQGQHWGQRTNFTTRPTNYDAAHKVVMLFNGPPTVNASDLCRNPGAVPFRTGPQPELHVLAVFCRYDTWLTQSEGWLKGGPQGVSPEGFAALIRQITADLFPPSNKNDPRRDSDSGDRIVP